MVEHQFNIMLAEVDLVYEEDDRVINSVTIWHGINTAAELVEIRKEWDDAYQEPVVSVKRGHPDFWKTRQDLVTQHYNRVLGASTFEEFINNKGISKEVVNFIAF